MSHKGPKCIVAGSLLLVIGIALSVGWIFGHTAAIEKVVDHRLHTTLVVDSTDSKNYYDWVQGIAERNPNYYNYSIWNLTNPDEVLQGAKPAFQLVGPYVYRYIWYNRNATFLDDGNQVQYNLIENYIFVPELSRNPKADMITNLNPAYVGVLNQAGSEDNMVTGVAIGMINYIIQIFTGDFPNMLASMYVPTQLPTCVTEVVNAITQCENGTQNAQEYFYSLWANATSAPDCISNYTNMIIGGVPTLIPMSTVAQLFDVNTQYSLMDNSTATIMMWLRAYQNNSSPEYGLLQQNFNLTDFQFNSVLQWREGKFIPTYVQPPLVDIARTVYSDAIWYDVGWIQFSYAVFIPTGILSVFGSYYPKYYPFYNTGNTPGNFEPIIDIIGGGNTYSSNLDEWQNLFLGANGLLNAPQGFEVIATAAFLGNQTQLAPWNITVDQAKDVFNYIIDLQMAYAAPMVAQFISEGSAGLMLTQSADYWLWSCHDPILYYLVGPTLASCGLQVNYTVQAPSTIWTGKDDISKLNSYVKWRGQSSIDGVWESSVPVKGYTDSGQFNPRVEENEHLPVFDENFVKTVWLTQRGKKSIQDIDTYMYTLDSSAYDASTLFTNTIQGTANETIINQAPIFLSPWNLMGVDPTYTNVLGMQPNPYDVTTLFVEPTTGATIYASNKLQINLYLPANSSSWFTFENTNYTNVPEGTLYPLVKIWQQSQIGPHDAKKLLDAKHLLKKVKKGLLWGIIGLGIFLALVGAVLVVRGIQLKRRKGYNVIY